MKYLVNAYNLMSEWQFPETRDKLNSIGHSSCTVHSLQFIILEEVSKLQNNVAYY